MYVLVTLPRPNFVWIFTQIKGTCTLPCTSIERSLTHSALLGGFRTVPSGDKPWLTRHQSWVRIGCFQGAKPSPDLTVSFPPNHFLSVRIHESSNEPSMSRTWISYTPRVVYTFKQNVKNQKKDLIRDYCGEHTLSLDELRDRMGYLTKRVGTETPNGCIFTELVLCMSTFSSSHWLFAPAF